MEQRGDTPFVFELDATADVIITLHQGRTVMTATEREVLIEPAKLDQLTHKITVEGTALTLANLSDSWTHDAALMRWRQAADRYTKKRIR
jgi:hypothetical protein